VIYCSWQASKLEINELTGRIGSQQKNGEKKENSHTALPHGNPDWPAFVSARLVFPRSIPPQMDA
jgi:hypothetical protein